MSRNNYFTKKTLFLYIQISSLLLCGCSKEPPLIHKPDKYEQGLEEVFYLNEQSKLFNKYVDYTIELHKDFTSTISYKTSNETKHTYKTIYAYDFTNAYDPNNPNDDYLKNYVMLEFEPYLSNSNEYTSSDGNYSGKWDIDLANGSFGVSFKENICAYFRYPKTIAYFSKRKKYNNNSFAIEKKYSLKEQNLYNEELKYDYLNIEFDNSQKCHIEYKIKNSDPISKTVDYEYVNFLPSIGNKKLINVLKAVETDIIPIGGLFYFENDNQLRYTYIPYNQGVPDDTDYSPNDYKSELLFEEIM